MPAGRGVSMPSPSLALCGTGLRRQGRTYGPSPAAITTLDSYGRPLKSGLYGGGDEEQSSRPAQSSTSRILLAGKCFGR